MLIGLTALIGSAIVVLIVGAHGAHALRAPAAVVRGPSFHPRGLMDTSGFTSVAQSLARWRPDSTLTELSAIWHDVGHRKVAQIDGILSSSALSPVDRFKLLMNKATFLNYEGDSRGAYELLAQTRPWVEGDPAIAEPALYSLIFFQGVTALRRGETDNCLKCRGESSCILPIKAAAVHTDPTGSRLAIRHFTEYLERFPDDLGVRWLLNLAHMTLGEHPQKVDSRYLISIDRFVKSEFDIGRFRDIGELAKVDRFNTAGGAVLEDFDNDGLLDLATTAFEPTRPMALYRNSGTGTFTETTQTAGLLDQLGGKNLVQTDFNNDGYVDLFISRGAWMIAPVRQSLLRNNGDGTFTDVTRAAGLFDPVNSTYSCWADYDNDGWLDVYIICEQQTNRLYHNRGDGSFEEVSERAGVQGNAQSFCKGANWIDYDNDDYPDLFVDNMRKNVDGRRFADITGSSGKGNLQKGHGVSCGDWDRDGDLDLFIEMGGASPGDQYHNILFANPGCGNHWLSLKLLGKQTNRAAIGARIKVVTTGPQPLAIHRQVSSGSSWGANPLEQHIGLGKAERIERLEVHWPTSGKTQIFRDLAADQAIQITEFDDHFRILPRKPVPQP